MSGYQKLALIAVGALGMLAPTVVQAAPMTEPPFVTFFSQSGNGTAGGWHRSTGYLMTFVHWNQKGPQWNVENISWVERWSGGGGGLVTPGPDEGGHGQYVDDSIPPWKRGPAIPEPASIGLVGAFIGSLALRRRVKA